MSSEQEQPGWLREPWVRALLLELLQRLEKPRTRDVTLRISPRSVPALYDFSADVRGRWQIIEQELVQRQVLDVTPDRRLQRHQEPYENALLRLRSESEDLLRHWLDRPRIDPGEAEWLAAIDRHAGSFADRGAALSRQRLVLPGLDAEQVVAALAAIGPLLEQNLSLRELSARCFRGNSKVLDQRMELLGQLFGERAQNIRPRPLLLTAWAPSGFDHLLIVENQDSFLRLAERPPAATALLFSAGFRASAGRICGAGTRFAFLPGSDAEYFQRHWQHVSGGSFFWGDLDYAGMDILRALRSALPRIQAWRPGYQLMLDALSTGQGHTPEQAGKERQLDPVITGCSYADEQLLPALRKHARFLDQEAFNPNTLPGGHSG